MSTRDGLPPLPAVDIRLHRAPGLSRPASLLADRLVEWIPALPEKGLWTD